MKHPFEKTERLADLIYWVILTMSLTYLFYLGLIHAGYGRDDTDSPTEISGMGLRTDHGTGCQYLVAPNGGITPRLAKGGQHMGCR